MADVLSIDFEYASASRERLLTFTRLSTCRNMYTVINCHEIVVGVATCSNPRGFPIRQGGREQTGIYRLAVNRLLFNAIDLLDVGSEHELLQWFVHKEEISILPLM